jgi:hypothetical protein
MIYTPRECVDMMQHRLSKYITNPCVCTKIEYKGYEISISMDSSNGPGDLTRSDIRVYTNPGSVPGVDCTDSFLEEGEDMLYGDGETLRRIFLAIDHFEVGN